MNAGRGAAMHSMECGGPPGSRTQRRGVGPLLRPAGAHRAAQRDMGAWKSALFCLVRQHLQALHEAGYGSMAVACGGLVVAHSGMILLGNRLTGL
jgi:hypothetical protein